MIIFLIWLAGYITNYFFFRWYIKRGDSVYTIGDRCFSLIVGILSWISVMGGLLAVIVEAIDSNKPAKW